MIDEAEYIDFHRGDRNRVIDFWGTYSIKFVTVVNAGGVIIVMGFMGAMKEVNPFNLFALICFLIGIILMGRVLLDLFEVHLKFKDELEKDIIARQNDKLAFGELCNRERIRDSSIIKPAYDKGRVASWAFFIGVIFGVLSLCPKVVGLVTDLLKSIIN